MANEDQSVWIVFNGEIYNHRELRRDLEARGHRFRTHSDTEAIVHAYEEYGDACVERLDGMFAFAIDDLRTPAACCWRAIGSARSRCFTPRFDGVLHFASEIKAIKASPVWNGEQRPRRDRGLSVARIFRRAGHRVSPRAEARARARAVRWTARRHRIRKYWDIEHFDTDTRASGGAAGRGRCAAGRGRVAPPGKRSADRRVPLGRHRFGPGRLVHGRSARQPPVTATVGFDHAAHNELEPARLDGGALSHHAPHGRRASRSLDDVLDPIVARVRRAVRGLVGDSDLLRQQDGAPARHGRAVGRRRRRSVRRLRVALHAARDGDRGAPARAR